MPPYQNGQNNPTGPNGYGQAPQPQPIPAPGPQMSQQQVPLQSYPAPASQPYVSGGAASTQPGEQDENRYDFFLNPAKKPQSGLLGGGSTKKLMLMAGGIVAVLCIVVLIVVASSGGKTDTTSLLSVAQTQQELIRVATDGTKNTQSSTLMNFSVTTQATLTSAQQQLLAIMLKHGTKVGTKVLALGHSAETDKALTAATAASTYDTTYKTIMQTGLDSYQNKLDDAAAATTSKSERALLQNQHSAAALLEKQLNQ